MASSSLKSSIAAATRLGAEHLMRNSDEIISSQLLSCKSWDAFQAGQTERNPGHMHFSRLHVQVRCSVSTCVSRQGQGRVGSHVAWCFCDLLAHSIVFARDDILRPFTYPQCNSVQENFLTKTTKSNITN